MVLNIITSNDVLKLFYVASLRFRQFSGWLWAVVFCLSKTYGVCLTNTARDVSKLSEISRDDEICKVTVNSYDVLIWRSSYDAIGKPGYQCRH